MKLLFLASILSLGVIFGQASPTEVDFTTTVNGQYATARGTYVGSYTIPQMIGRNSVIGQGYSSTATANVMQYFSDSLHSIGYTWQSGNLDMTPVLQNNSAALTKMDTALTYIAQTLGSNFEMDVTWSQGGSQGKNSPFTSAFCTAHAGSCTVTSGNCASPGCITNFSGFQSVVLANTGTLATALNRWGASGILGSKLKIITVAHEPSGNMDPALNPNWDTTTNGQGSPADWLGFAQAAVTLIRSANVSSCTGCATAKLGFTTTSNGDDLNLFFPAVCVAASTLDVCGADIYPPGNVTTTVYGNVVSTMVAAAAAAGLPMMVEEANPANWTPGYNPQSEGSTYKGGASKDWLQLNKDILWARTFLQFISVQGFKYCNAPFAAFKMIWYTNNASAYNGCGNDGTECGVDQVTDATFIGNFYTQLNTATIGITPFGSWMSRFLSNGFNGAF